ncbi:MAG: heme ABC exporter ATP-binding protein CcmA [Alphaproteobacteria bacterium]|nr:heme ABC exporter ATP-binding protein CcmA [Alphaproteobacteria bacterium]
MPTILTANHITAITETDLLFNLSFELRGGQALHIAGKNGTGKSTLLVILAGLLEPFSGEFSYISNHYIGHDNGLHPDETVAETLALWRVIYGQTADMGHLLRDFALDDKQHTKTNQLSAGQKRKLNLLRLKIVTRPLWILDEADNALDDASCQILQQWIHQHLTQQGMVIFTNHGAPLITPHQQIILDD